MTKQEQKQSTHFKSATTIELDPIFESFSFDGTEPEQTSVCDYSCDIERLLFEPVLLH